MRWLKRFRCQHYYVEDYRVFGWPDPKMLYHCIDCGKVTIRRPSSPPVNPLRETNQQYYNRMVASGNAHLVMRPSLGTEDYPKEYPYA